VSDIMVFPKIIRLLLISAFLAFLMVTSTHGTSLTKAVDNCKPEKLAALPLQLQNICMTLLEKILESDYDSANENNESFGKEAADPNHIFLRFGRSRF